MRAVIQRVGHTKLSVEGRLIAEIEKGLVVYLGVGADDTAAQCAPMAKKIAQLRIFEDAGGKMNLSVQEAGGEVLLVSQFTLYGDCRHGNRPSFIAAARPEAAEPLYEEVIRLLSERGLRVKKGVFGADMKIEQYNDGPVTVLFEC